jgi:DNA-binding PadR family transcriptional regulator
MQDISAQLVTLAMLRKRPLHSYEIKHILELHVGDWATIALGPIALP